MKAEIITIGDEILIGQVIDTNSAWLSEQLNIAGIEVYQVTSVHDDLNHIYKTLELAEKNNDLVIITGGLGPTKDDITKTALCKYFDTHLVFHEPTFQNIIERFKLRSISINEQNRNQAMVPESCTVLPNKEGSAPGMWFERNNTIFISVPGVPYEMKQIISDEAIPRLINKPGLKTISHKTILTQGIPESILAEKLEKWEKNLPSNIKLAYLPSPMAVRLRLSASGKNKDQVERLIKEKTKELQRKIPEFIYGFDNDLLAEVIGNLLIKKNKHLAVAESCTGGYISHLITSIPGSSAYFKGSVTAYSNEVKENILGVSPDTLNTYGAVSKETALEMAKGIKNRLNADYAIATTGISGPDGGSETKPVGTVWISVVSSTEEEVKKYIFGKNRERNIIRSGQTALQMLRRMLVQTLH